eukprot:scaffold119425_cov69-Phaeocystis_antarctica.AAC.1
MPGWTYDDALAERRSCVLSAFPSAPCSLSSCCSLLSRLRACKTASPKETMVKPKVVSKQSRLSCPWSARTSYASGASASHRAVASAPAATAEGLGRMAASAMDVLAAMAVVAAAMVVAAMAAAVAGVEVGVATAAVAASGADLEAPPEGSLAAAAM